MRAAPPPRDIDWIDVQRAIGRGDSATIAAMRGRIDWSTVDAPDEVVEYVYKPGGGSNAMKEATCQLLEIAADELDDGGDAMFAMHDGRPIRTLITHYCKRALHCYLRAGFNPETVIEIPSFKERSPRRHQTALDFARGWWRDGSSLVSMMRAHVARHRALQAVDEFAANSPRVSAPR